MLIRELEIFYFKYEKTLATSNFYNEGNRSQKRIFLQYFYVVLKEKNDENIINFKFFLFFLIKLKDLIKFEYDYFMFD